MIPPILNTYQYATKTGQLRELQAGDPEEALRKLPTLGDADPASGVMLKPTAAPARELGEISSIRGLDIVKKAERTASGLQIPPAIERPVAEKAVVEKPTDNSLTLLNPSGQRLKFYDPD